MFNLPNHLEPHAGQLMGIQTDAAVAEAEAARRRLLWAVVLGLTPVLAESCSLDQGGERVETRGWCVHHGQVRGFGRTPEEAFLDFEKEMGKTR